MKIYWSVKFFAYGRRGHPENGVSIRMRITLRGEIPVDIATGFIIPAGGWNAKLQLANPGTPQADEVNRTVNVWRATVSEAMSRYELIEKRKPTRAEIRDLFNDLVGRDTPVKQEIGDNDGIDLYPCLDLFVERMGKKNQWTPATHEKFRALKGHLKDFDPLLSFYTLDESKLQDYVEYLIDIGMRNTTISKHLAFLRWFLRWASQSGYYGGKLHETFRPKLKGVSGGKEIISPQTHGMKIPRNKHLTNKLSAFFMPPRNPLTMNLTTIRHPEALFSNGNARRQPGKSLSRRKRVFATIMTQNSVKVSSRHPQESS